MLYLFNFKKPLLSGSLNILSPVSLWVPGTVLSWVYVSLGASQVVLVVENLPADAGDAKDVGLIPGSGRSLGGGHGNPLEYSCLESPMDRAAYQAAVHKVTKSWTQMM